MAGRNSNSGSSFKGNLVPYKDRMLLKNVDAGNSDKRTQQVNDWVFGPVGSDVLGGWSKYTGGDENDPNSYELTSYEERNNFPDI